MVERAHQTELTKRLQARPGEHCGFNAKHYWPARLSRIVRRRPFDRPTYFDPVPTQRYAFARKAVEFTTELSASQTLQIPSEAFRMDQAITGFFSSLRLGLESPSTIAGAERDGFLTRSFARIPGVSYAATDPL